MIEQIANYVFLIAPLFLVLIVVFAVRQQRTYGAHIDRVNEINDNNAALTRTALEISQEAVAELREIKELLKGQSEQNAKTGRGS